MVAQQSLNLFVVVQIHVGQPRFHFAFPLATISSACAGVTLGSKSSFNSTTGALPQSARHSTNSTVNFPSGVVCGGP